MRVSTAIVLCIGTAVTAFNLSYLAFQRKFEESLPEYQAKEAIYGKLGQIRDLFDTYYVGTYDEQDAVDMAATGYVVGVGDQWSGYYSAEGYEEYVTSFSGQSFGVGIYVSYSADTGIRIIEVYADSDGVQAGLKRGDRILAADGVSLEEEGYNAVMEAMKGDEGTTVQVTIQSGETGEVRDVTLKRKMIEQTMVSGWMLPDNIGFVRLYNFNQGSEVQFKNTIDTLLDAGAQALVFDVRNNPGGAVTSVNEMLDLLLPAGDLMGLASKAGKDEQYTSDAACLELPMAVLVDKESISAAEFFAACLQEYDWATIVGQQTIGKGYSQRMYSLTDGSAVRISDKTYFMPSGKSLIGTGVTPDVIVELPAEKEKEFYFLAPEEDEQVTAALASLSNTE